ncbi:MAG: peptide chain release factor N(5)-glutamine methyltransferase [Paludibacteraceae bacterium]|nr:peptide chain release factor N(5)-glutamine methyltransferase [Prevotellaceae bacterium]
MHNILNHFIESLSGIYSRNEIQCICSQVMQHLCNCNKAALFATNGIVLTDGQKEKLDFFIKRLQANEPVQYVIGYCDFFDIKLHVNKSVLIPRPETEELVEWILNDNPKSDGSLFDICTGSGCIAITIKKYKPKFTVSALDFSDDAIHVAQENAEMNECSVHFLTDDILHPSKAIGERFDIIVSNPPYVMEKEKSAMSPNVLDYEPSVALFVPNEDPLRFYQAIGAFGQSHLNAGGKLYFEINETQGKATIALLKEQGYKYVTLKKDIFGKDRMIRADI